jgi:hypothetical protein
MKDPLFIVSWTLETYQITKSDSAVFNFGCSSDYKYQFYDLKEYFICKIDTQMFKVTYFKDCQ